MATSISTLPTVFVIGASGYVGKASVTSLSQSWRDKVEIKAGVRNPNSDKAEVLKALPGVTVVQATMGESSLINTFKGVFALYIVTPTAENRVHLVSSTALSAKEAGVKHIVVVSTQTAKFPDTAFGSHYAEIEHTMAELGLPYTILRLPMFMDGYVHYKHSIKNGVLRRPIDPDLAYHATTVADIGKASAAVLANPQKYVNQTIAILGDRHTANDFISIISEILKRDIKYERNSFEDARQRMKAIGMPDWIADGLTEVAQLMGSTTVYSEGDLDAFKCITGNDATTLRNWIEENLDKFL